MIVLIIVLVYEVVRVFMFVLVCEVVRAIVFVLVYEVVLVFVVVLGCVRSFLLIGILYPNPCLQSSALPVSECQNTRDRSARERI